MSVLLKLSFVTTGGSKKIFNISSPKEGLDSMAVKTVMDSMISSGIFRTSTGALTMRDGAEYITTTTSKIL